jgi:signal transduction histidine kinase
VSWIVPELEPFLAIAAAVLDGDGTLIEANSGFVRLLQIVGPAPIGERVDRFFIQPDFSTLQLARAGVDGEIHRGLMTIGDYMGLTRTLRARAWRVEGRLRVLAEYDIDELERLNDAVLVLNRDYASAQLDLAQNNLKLKQHEVQLEKLVAELNSTNLALKLTQSQLLHAEKMAAVGQLAAGVAHQINTPIGFVNSNLGTLRRYNTVLLDVIEATEIIVEQHPELFAKLAEITAGADLDYLREDSPSLVRESQEGLDRVKHIVQSLQDFAQPKHANMEQSDLLACLESTLDVIWSEIKDKAEVVRDLTPLPLVRCIPSQINQVLMNLLVNAAQSIEDRGTIVLRSGSDGDGVWIEIADNGVGMSDEVSKRLFEPFFTTRPVGKGTGLGLSISWDIIANKHGGRIEVKSSVGAGATFRIWLPTAH